MSLLTLTQNACRRLALAVPSAAFASTDTQVQQLVALANEEGEELASRCQWSILDLEATFTTVATPADMVTVAPGFKYLINETMWDRTENRIIKPITAQEWQEVNSNTYTSPFTKFRIWQGAIYFYPDLAADHDIAFEYMSKNWVALDAGGTSDAWAADADTGLLDERIMTMGLIWRFKQVKGFDWEPDFQKYEARVADAMARDGSKKILNMGGRYRRNIRDNIPEGSWS